MFAELDLVYFTTAKCEVIVDSITMKFSVICLVFGIACCALSVESYVLQEHDETGQSNRVRTDRIMGGQIARRNQFPYQVALILSLPGNQQTFCAGSILNNNYILSNF
jgi:secreted trypsin-like serine protease